MGDISDKMSAPNYEMEWAQCEDDEFTEYDYNGIESEEEFAAKLLARMKAKVKVLKDDKGKLAKYVAEAVHRESMEAMERTCCKALMHLVYMHDLWLVMAEAEVQEKHQGFSEEWFDRWIYSSMRLPRSSGWMMPEPSLWPRNLSIVVPSLQPRYLPKELRSK